MESTQAGAINKELSDEKCAAAIDTTKSPSENAVIRDEVHEMESDNKECVKDQSAEEAVSHSNKETVGKVENELSPVVTDDQRDSMVVQTEQSAEPGGNEHSNQTELNASASSPVATEKVVTESEKVVAESGKVVTAPGKIEAEIEKIKAEIKKIDIEPAATSSNAAVSSQAVDTAVSSPPSSSNAAVSSQPADTVTSAPPADEQPTSSRARDVVSPADQIYHVKWIDFYKTKTPIVTQNENGPCPMLAIMNVLLLRGQVDLPPEAEVVTGAQLIERLGDCILRLAPENLADQLRTDYEQNVSDAVAMLTKLMTGLDVNVKFTGISDFEYTSECVVFDLLGIPLYHGWLIDPQHVQLAELIGRRGYNQLVEMIIESSSSADPEKQTEAFLARSFLESSASQLTIHGLCELNLRLRDGELAVLFRNNHFATLLKHRDELFSLVTDQGFLQEAAVVWETLNSVDGDSHFVDAELHTSPLKTSPLPSSANLTAANNDTKNDYLVALSLDQQERAAAAQTVIGETPSPTTNFPDANIDSDAVLARQLQEEWNRASTTDRNPAAGGRRPQQQQPQHQQQQPQHQPHPQHHQTHVGAGGGGSPHRERDQKQCNIL
uniref:Ubiquitin carboxyl-terminal hydrolase n=1 Tax=Plectus sambesii TaxID=2011161 RepID=A0A914V409_9BILA